MNGNVADKFLSSIDPDDPDYQQQLIRPAEVKEDVKLMEHRKRVSLILSSEAFREELEQIVDSQLRSGPQPVSLLALQQIAEALQLPRSGSVAPTAIRGVIVGSSTPGAPLPINDIRGVDSLSYSKGERLLRCKLASVCRLLDVFGWVPPTPGGSTISARVTGDRDNAPSAFLATPYGLLAHEVTASSLIKMDAHGKLIDAGSTPFGASATWQSLDGPLYASRPSLRCILHLRTAAAVALSAAKTGLAPLTAEAVACGRVAVLDGPEAAATAGDAHVFLVRNIGLVCCGESVEEAFYYAQRAVQACEAQLAASVLGINELHLLGESQCEAVRAALESQLEALPRASVTNSQSQSLSRADGADSGNLMVGELEFEAYMRYLDNAGFRTGYPYRISVVKHGHAHKAHDQGADVEVPPTASSLAEELQQFDLAHGTGRATQLLKEVSAAKKSATLPAGGVRKMPSARTAATPQATLPREAPEQRELKLAVADVPPSKVVANDKSVATPVPAPAPVSAATTSPSRSERDARAQIIPPNDNALARASLQISTPVGNFGASADVQRPKSERYPSDGAKLEATAELSPKAAIDEEDGSGKKDKKKDKSGIFASLSKKKEKAK